MARFGLRYMNGWIPLAAGAFTIGRGDECNLLLDDPGASRNHAVLHVGEEGVELEDAGSRNGIVLNGEKLGARTTLNNGDAIEIGSQRLVFEIEEEDAEEDPITGERKKRRRLQTVQMKGPVPSLSDEETDAGSRPDTALVEEAQQMLSEDDAGGAAGLMSIVVRRLVTAGQKGKPVEKQILTNAARCLVDLAVANDDWQWIERAFEVHDATKTMVASNVIDVVHMLAKELKPRRSRVIGEYHVNMRAIADRLTFEERVVLRRLDGLAKLVGGGPSSIPPKSN